MLLYTKVEVVDGASVRKIYGTTDVIPSENDKEIIVKDENGGEFIPAAGDIYENYVDEETHRNGGIKVKRQNGDTAILTVFVDTDGEDEQVIPAFVVEKDEKNEDGETEGNGNGAVEEEETTDDQSNTAPDNPNELDPDIPDINENEDGETEGNGNGAGEE